MLGGEVDGCWRRRASLDHPLRHAQQRKTIPAPPRQDLVAPVSAFPQAQLQAIAKALGDTEDGLSGSEIASALSQCRLSDPGAITKWIRIYNPLAEDQNARGDGSRVIGFIRKSMKPALWVTRKARFEKIRGSVNEALAFSGLALSETGEVVRTTPATTIDEARARADRLRSELERRGVHADVITFCRAELLEENYFHAVLEASKSIAARIRSLSGLTSDGAELVLQALSLGQTGQPLLAINALLTDTERSEQRGFCNLLVGVFGMFRNPTAHEPRISWALEEADALDMLTTMSLVHRKLDKARRL